MIRRKNKNHKKEKVEGRKKKIIRKRKIGETEIIENSDDKKILSHKRN